MISTKRRCDGGCWLERCKIELTKNDRLAPKNSPPMSDCGKVGSRNHGGLEYLRDKVCHKPIKIAYSYNNNSPRHAARTLSGSAQLAWRLKGDIKRSMICPIQDVL